MKLSNILVNLVLGKNVIELIWDYFRFKDEHSEEGKKLSGAEQKHLEGIVFRIGENILARFIPNVKKQKKG